MLKENQRGVSTIIAIIVAIFIIGGAAVVVIYINNNQTDIEQVVEESQSDQAAQTSSDLPSLYTQAGLPEYPNGAITDKREGNDLVDGVQVTWETSDTIETVKSFFDTELTNIGFDLPSSSVPASEYAYFGIYTDESKKFTLQIIKIGETSNNKIHVNYHE